MAPALILLDANVLVYAISATAPQHAACLTIVSSGITCRPNTVLVPQVLLELYARS
jgi:predicted nucleic acid-binding protein